MRYFPFGKASEASLSICEAGGHHHFVHIYVTHIDEDNDSVVISDGDHSLRSLCGTINYEEDVTYFVFEVAHQ